MASVKQTKNVNLPVYDIDELKSLMRKMRSRKQELTLESTELTQQLESLATQYANAKYEENALGVDDEIQILNQDIKQALPKLEQDALYWEQQMHGLEKESKNAAGSIAVLPSNLTKSTAELEQLFLELTEKKNKLTGNNMKCVVVSMMC